jgi:hypothetical protein
MASFGSFETERETYSGPTYTVYSAKKQGEPKTEYAVKVFSVHHIGLEAESVTQLDPLLSDIEKACVQRIGVQQKTAETSKLVAPILETGSDERGVWYATTFYPRSVNKIISGRVALNREALQHIILSIAQGALDIKRACGRSHGEILPSNIQISRSEKLAEAEVVLSDPMPGTQAEAVRYELSDLRGIGRILLQLVARREINQEEDFLILPILASPEWTQLFGKATDTWLALCNKLLDPNLSLGQLTLEQLVAELEKLKPETGIPPKVLIAIAAGVVVLGVLAFLIMRPRTQTVEVTSDPPGATILVDNKEQEGKTPLKLKFINGNYPIEARHEEMRLREQTTNWVAQGGGSAKLHFRFPYGSVSIKSEPPGATIKRGGTEIGKTPMEIPVVAADVEVVYELSLTDYVDQTVRGVVRNGQKLPLSETLPLSKDSGTVDMDSTPGGAMVYLKDKLLTPTGTPGRTTLVQGMYTLLAKYKEDWPAKEIKVEVKKGETVPANFSFEYGQVRVDSDPQGANVWVGTNSYGLTPVTVPRPVGKTTFHFELVGFEPTNEVVTVADKSTPRVKPSLLTSNGIFELNAEPASATAHIFDGNGKELGTTSGGNPIKVTLTPGQYAFSARMDGLNDVTATLPVQKREIKKHTFVFDYGTARLESVPPGATITANGKQVGITPATFVQKPGNTVSYQIAKENYQAALRDMKVESRENGKAVVELEKVPVSVALASIPPGAEFYTDTGTPLKLNGEYFTLPWGPTNLIARHRRLVPRTNAVDIPPGKFYKAEPFKFVYGTLVLTNLEGYTIKEGADEVQNAAASLKESYEVPGMHTYELYDGGTKIDTLKTNIEADLFTVLFSALAGDKRNSIGMRLVKVRNLLGPGQDAWVGKTEVTQGEYKAVMGGENPSEPALGNEYPVQNVTWQKASEFCEKLSQNEKNPPTRAGKYQLPTQEQWLRFAAGTELKNSVYGATNSAPVGSKEKNGFGLYDVFGNVSEWLDGGDATNKDYIGGSFKTRPMMGGMGVFTNTQQLKLDRAFDRIGFRVIWVPSR